MLAWQRDRLPDLAKATCLWGSGSSCQQQHGSCTEALRLLPFMIIFLCCALILLLSWPDVLHFSAPADYPIKSGSNSPASASPRSNSFRIYDPQGGSTVGIQGSTVSPPSLSAPNSARGLGQGDGIRRDSSYGSFTMQQQLHLNSGISPAEGSGAQPLEYGSPPQVSRSGSWTALANGGSVNSSFSREGLGINPVTGVTSILSRPPSALAGGTTGGGGSSVSSSNTIEVDPQKRAKLADYYHARGYAARKQGNFKGAVEEYTRALSLSPAHFKALFNRGFSYDKVRP